MAHAAPPDPALTIFWDNKRQEGSCRYNITIGYMHASSLYPLLHKTVNTGPYRLLQPLDETTAPISGQAHVLYPSVALGTCPPCSIHLTKPHVCYIPSTYTRTYPSGPCTPYETDQCIEQTCDQYSSSGQFNGPYWWWYWIGNMYHNYPTKEC